MTRRLVTLTLDNLGELPVGCRGCLVWQLDPVSAGRACSDGTAEAEKQAWVSRTLLQWGSCGQLVLVDGVLAGHALYAPPAYVPRADGFATAPISTDAVLLTSVNVQPAFAGGGLGRMLVQGVARDVLRRGVRAVEAFGWSAEPTVEAAYLPDTTRCLPPTDFLRAVGFRTVRTHPRTPRLRMEMRSLVTWREDVEGAFERFRGTWQVPSLSR